MPYGHVLHQFNAGYCQIMADKWKIPGNDAVRGSITWATLFFLIVFPLQDKGHTKDSRIGVVISFTAVLQSCCHNRNAPVFLVHYSDASIISFMGVPSLQTSALDRYKGRFYRNLPLLPLADNGFWYVWNNHKPVSSFPKSSSLPTVGSRLLPWSHLSCGPG